MKIVRRKSQFKRDVKRMKRRAADFSAFKEIIRKLATGERLEARYRDHLLVGQYIRKPGVPYQAGLAAYLRGH